MTLRTKRCAVGPHLTYFLAFSIPPSGVLSSFARRRRPGMKSARYRMITYHPLRLSIVFVRGRAVPPPTTSPRRSPHLAPIVEGIRRAVLVKVPCRLLRLDSVVSVLVRAAAPSRDLFSLGSVRRSKRSFESAEPFSIDVRSFDSGRLAMRGRRVGDGPFHHSRRIVVPTPIAWDRVFLTTAGELHPGLWSVCPFLHSFVVI
jgi:hypothetical protein